MYIRIGGTDYRAISDLVFAPEADVTGSSIPVNEFLADIRTEDTITVGARAALYDDLDRLWAKYWITYAERKDAYTLHVEAQSAIRLLERDMLDPAMFDQTPVTTVLSEIMARLDGEWSLDQSFSGATISGFCPEQTARNRLQWVCLVIGAYLKDFDGDRPMIVPVVDDDHEIPLGMTYWKPKVNYRDYVTAVRAFYYTYSEQVPSTTDTWVEVNGDYYVQNERQLTLRDPTVPETALEHVVTVQGVTIINEANIDDVLTNMARFYFLRAEVDMSCVDNAEWWPADKVLVHTDDFFLVEGYIDKATFTFGTQAKASIHVTAASDTNGASLVLSYIWDDKTVSKRRYTLPVGYEYRIDNPYLTWSFAGHRYVFRPLEEYAEGTIQEGGTEDEQEVAVALDMSNRILSIVSVDSFTDVQNERYTVGVIA